MKGAVNFPHFCPQPWLKPASDISKEQSANTQSSLFTANLKIKSKWPFWWCSDCQLCILRFDCSHLTFQTRKVLVTRKTSSTVRHGWLSTRLGAMHICQTCPCDIQIRLSDTCTISRYYSIVSVQATVDFSSLRTQKLYTALASISGLDMFVVDSVL